MYFVLGIFGDTSEMTYIGPSRCILQIDWDLRTSGWALKSQSRCIAYWNQSNNTSERPLDWAFPMYVPKTIHSRYIGIQTKHQIPMYPKKEYIGTPQKLAIPMYLPLQVYQIKQPALPLTSNSRRISAQIIVRLTRAGVCCEGKRVESREIN